VCVCVYFGPSVWSHQVKSLAQYAQSFPAARNTLRIQISCMWQQDNKTRNSVLSNNNNNNHKCEYEYEYEEPPRGTQEATTTTTKTKWDTKNHVHMYTAIGKCWNTNCSLLIKWQLMHINNAITSTMKLQTRQLQIDCPVNTLPRVCSWHSQSGQLETIKDQYKKKT